MERMYEKEFVKAAKLAMAILKYERSTCGKGYLISFLKEPIYLMNQSGELRVFKTTDAVIKFTTKHDFHCTMFVNNTNDRVVKVVKDAKMVNDGYIQAMKGVTAKTWNKDQVLGLAIFLHQVMHENLIGSDRAEVLGCLSEISVMSDLNGLIDNLLQVNDTN